MYNATWVNIGLVGYTLEQFGYGHTDRSFFFLHETTFFGLRVHQNRYFHQKLIIQFFTINILSLYCSICDKVKKENIF